MDILKCPVCDENLEKVIYENQEVDVCQSCGGVWFDKEELLNVVDRLLSKNLIEPASIKEAYEKKAMASRDVEQSSRYCPRCKAELKVFNYSYDSNVFLDRCPSCQGIWADRSELEAVGKYLKGNPEVDKYAEILASELKKYSRLSSGKGKAAAVAVALFYLVFAYFLMGLEGSLRILLFLVLPLGCIFFGEPLGRLTEVRFSLTFLRPMLTKRTPGFFVVLSGWLLLLFPIFVFIYEFFTNK
jgi:Zn-finger nucleic acid-binding protein